MMQLPSCSAKVDGIWQVLQFTPPLVSGRRRRKEINSPVQGWCVCCRFDGEGKKGWRWVSNCRRRLQVTLCVAAGDGYEGAGDRRSVWVNGFRGFPRATMKRSCRWVSQIKKLQVDFICHTDSNVGVYGFLKN
jgi:hypothetical protein